MYIVAGFIVGFDTETKTVAADMVDCIEATSIPICMVVLLTALPNTQLTRRLEREGRLFPGYDAVLPERGDQCTAVLNFVPARPRRDILQDYKEVLERIYAPAAFFHRLTTVGRVLRRPALRVRPNHAAVAKDLAILARVAWRMTIHKPALSAGLSFLAPASVLCVLQSTGSGICRGDDSDLSARRPLRGARH